MSRVTTAVTVLASIVLLARGSEAAKLMCPDTLTDDKTREVMATSAPEIKVRASAQNDSQKWMEVVRPLIRKAAKLAKEQRSKIIAEGVENSCSAPQQYVGQTIPVPDKASGCDHKIVIRSADDEHVWVQAVAVCKYDWACCSFEDSSKTAGYMLEGPMNPQTSTSTAIKK